MFTRRNDARARAYISIVVIRRPAVGVFLFSIRRADREEVRGASIIIIIIIRFQNVLSDVFREKNV